MMQVMWDMIGCDIDVQEIVCVTCYAVACVCARFLAAQFMRTPLHQAAEGGHEAVVEYLVGHGADMEAKDKVRRIAEVCVF